MVRVRSGLSGRRTRRELWRPVWALGRRFKWGSQLKRDIATQEQQLGVKPKPSVDLAKAMWRRDDEWEAACVAGGGALGEDDT
jgi:hypothetical protein